MIAQAPSEICEELPAVWMAVGMTGRPGEPLHGGVPQPFVVVDEAPHALPRRLFLLGGRHLDRVRLPFEAFLGPGHGCPLLRDQPERVDVLPSEAPFAGDAFCGLELVGQIDVPLVRPGLTGAVLGAAAQRYTRHGLDTAADTDVDDSGGDHIGDHVGSLLRAALTVHGGGGGLVRESDGEPGVARRVHGLFAGMRDRTADDLFDAVGMDAGAAQEFTVGLAQQIGGVQIGERASALADGVRTASTMTGSAAMSSSSPRTSAGGVPAPTEGTSTRSSSASSLMRLTPGTQEPCTHLAPTPAWLTQSSRNRSGHGPCGL